MQRVSPSIGWRVSQRSGSLVLNSRAFGEILARRCWKPAPRLKRRLAFIGSTENTVSRAQRFSWPTGQEHPSSSARETASYSSNDRTDPEALATEVEFSRRY